MKNKPMIKGIGLLITVSLFLTACGDSIPILTENDNDRVTEYAASILLKYDSNYESRLVDTSVVPEDILKLQEEKKEEPPKELQLETPTADVNDISQDGGAQSKTVEDFFGLQGVRVDYSGYQITTSYSSGDEGEWMPSIDATNGKNLFVLNLTISNISDQTVEVNMLSSNARFLINLNDEIAQTALTTMLLNDFATLDETIEAGASLDTVLIIEIPVELESVNSISLYMKNQSESNTINL